MWCAHTLQTLIVNRNFGLERPLFPRWMMWIASQTSQGLPATHYQRLFPYHLYTNRPDYGLGWFNQSWLFHPLYSFGSVFDWADWKLRLMWLMIIVGEVEWCVGWWIDLIAHSILVRLTAKPAAWRVVSHLYSDVPTLPPLFNNNSPPTSYWGQTGSWDWCDSCIISSLIFPTHQPLFSCIFYWLVRNSLIQSWYM